ncbi:hypothetical protein Rhopal_003321-T1 [Rhodotorula paludigena]|uniref:Uncharacterized protein n=1 Tax=Rhodotorula paludigena TaxID=86838 RepID=A0AAV5GLS5_9BASI|nr:hypothetical protein Rhopal_003321-T1 [Rhodotorula paludigena]
MSSFAVRLDRLLDQLRTLSSSPSDDPSSRLQRLVVRTERAYSALRDAGTPAPAELFVRLRGRLEELGDGLLDAQSAAGETGGSPSWAQLFTEAGQVLRDVEELLQGTSGAHTSASKSHSRTPSVDLPRRMPTSQPVLSASTSAAADLDAYLASSARTRTSPTSSASPTPVAFARATALSEACSLFLLAHDPTNVLPPGETLRSIFRSHNVPTEAADKSAEPSASLESRISTQLHRAYFDSFAALFAPGSSASSADKLEAWSRLAQDLQDAALPLVPSRLKTDDGSGVSARDDLSRALAPSTAAAWEPKVALEAVERVVHTLSRLCAPARDAEARSLAADASAAAQGAAGGSQLVALVQRTLELARGMDDDMRRFRRGVAGELAGEDDLREVVREEAGARERTVVLEWFGGKEGVKSETWRCCARALGREVGETGEVVKEDVAAALAATLFADDSIALPPFDASSADSSAPAPPNLLPPILLVPSPRLFDLQNRFQALVILACLATLAGPAPPSTAAEQPAALVSRLWTILESEFAPPAPSPAQLASSSSPPASEPSPTRLANLADELIAYRRRSADATASPPPGEEEAARMRASVDRVLRTQDPVYKLFKGRLREAVGAAMRDAVSAAEGARGEPVQRVPTGAMRSGREVARGGTPRAKGAERAQRRVRDVRMVVPKGFEAPTVLREKVEETVRERLVQEVWGWVEEVWGGVLGWKRADVDESAASA